MNNQRRLLIEKAKKQISEVEEMIEKALEDEQDSYDNLPEGIQMSERGEKMEDAISSLENAVEKIAEIIECLDEAAG